MFMAADTAFEGSRLTALVNNAGGLGPSGTELSQVGHAAALAEVMATNVAGPLMCCREAEKRMSTKAGGQGGSIVQISSGTLLTNLSIPHRLYVKLVLIFLLLPACLRTRRTHDWTSGSAYIGRPLLYASSKGALNSLTIGLIKPFAEVGIRLNTVSPGMTDTDLVAEAAKTFDFSQIPLGRMGRPQEIADTVCWLCSDEASYVAGANIRVAGGRPPGTTLG